MAKFSFSINKNSSQKNNIKQTNSIQKNSTKVELIEKVETINIPEKYTYLDKNGKEVKFSGILSKTVDNKAFGKVYKPVITNLIYHPGIESVIGSEEYYSYIDDNMNEHVYKGDILEVKDENNNITYIGKIVITNFVDNQIQIFKEEK